MKPVRFAMQGSLFICAKCQRPFQGKQAVLTHYGIMHMHGVGPGPKAPDLAAKLRNRAVRIFASIARARGLVEEEEK